MMSCICAMIALIFISHILCCAPSCVCLSAAFIMRACISHLRAGFLPAFMRLFICLLRIGVPPSRGLSFVQLSVRCLHVDFRLCSRTLYSLIRYPWDCVRVHWCVWLSIC
jgi:hypothetical protein